MLGNRSRRRGRRLLILCAGGAAALSLAAPVTAAVPVRRAPTPLQRGLQFYRGKTITLIANAAPGNPPYIWAALIAPIMDSYLGANVVIEAEGQAGGIPAQDNLAASPPDGLTIGELSFSADLNNLLTQAPGLNFNPARLPFLGGNFGAAQVMVAAPKSPYLNIKTVLGAKSALPMITTISGGTSVVIHALSGIYGIPMNFLGYPTTGAMLAGFLRGDGPLAYQSIATLYGPIEAGIARPIVLGTDVSGQVPAQLQADLGGVPTLAQVFAKYPPKSKLGRRAEIELETFLTNPLTIFAAPARTPSDEVLALRAAIKLGLTNKAALTTGFNSFAGGGYISGSDAKARYLSAAAGLGPLEPFVPKV